MTSFYLSITASDEVQGGSFNIKMNQKQNKIKKFLKESLRVIKVLKKPGKDEFKTIVKITSLGIVVIGLIGFVIVIIKQLLF